MKLCYNCQCEWVEDFKPGFRDQCDQCGVDLHVCLNCRFYDPNAYNRCSEPVAEKVSEYDKSNYCTYFEWKESTEKVFKSRKDYKSSFDNLFKN